MFVLRRNELLERCRARWGGMFSLRLPMQRPWVVISDEAAIREVFALRPEDVSVGAAYDWLRPFLGGSSLFLLDGERHLRERRLMMPPFHRQRMQAYAASIRGIAARAMQAWPIDRAFAIEPAMRAITLDVILETVLGAHGSAREALRRATLALLEDFSPVNMIPALRVELGGRTPWGRFVRHRDALDRILYDSIRERREERGGDRDDVLAMLLDARYEDGTAMRDSDLRDQLLTLIGAGHETSTSALAWTFQCLAHEPAALSRAEDEVRTSSPDAELPWLDATIQETMRLHSVFPSVDRVLERPQTIGGHRLAAGTHVYVSIDLAHRSPALWREPERFDPARFLDARPSPFAYFPFGGGARRCIGMAYASLEMRVIVAEALRRFRITPVGPFERAATRGFTRAPAKGGRVKLVRR
jgi:cytochrome P450